MFRAVDLRLQKDVSMLQLPPNMDVVFPNVDDLTSFKLNLSIEEGYYNQAKLTFQFQFKPTYPHDPPRVLCLNKIFHPNIDPEGHVCLNILREDWSPVLDLSAIIFGIYHLFLEPSCEEPLNQEAGHMLRDDPSLFARTVTSTLQGQVWHNIQYDDCMT